MKTHPTLLKSFGYATKGLWTAMKTERNIRIQLAAAALAVALGFALRLHHADPVPVGVHDADDLLPEPVATPDRMLAFAEEVVEPEAGKAGELRLVGPSPDEP